MARLNFDFSVARPLREERATSYSFYCGQHGRVCWSDECDALPKECVAPECATPTPTPLAQHALDALAEECSECIESADLSVAETLDYLMRIARSQGVTLDELIPLLL
jgi:hypothetical protein